MAAQHINGGARNPVLDRDDAEPLFVGVALVMSMA
jgi:hypothetical protein